MPASTFRREVPAGCLSGFMLSKAAMGALDAAERNAVDAHLATCARCSALVRAEQNDVAAAHLEPVPSRILGITPARPPWWKRLLTPSTLAGLAVIGAAAVVLAIARPWGGASVAGIDDTGHGETGGVRTKGSLSIEATVLRGKELIAEDARLDALGVLKDGDRLRLRVRNGAGASVRVESLDDGRWIAVHEGVVPADGWIPLGLTVMAGSETKLRVKVCPTPVDMPTADGDACITEAQTLDVR